MPTTTRPQELGHGNSGWGSKNITHQPLDFPDFKQPQIGHIKESKE